MFNVRDGYVLQKEMAKAKVDIINLQKGQSVDLNNYYTKAEIDESLNAINMVVTGVKFYIVESSWGDVSPDGMFIYNLNHGLNLSIESLSLKFYCLNDSLMLDYSFIDDNNIKLYSSEAFDLTVIIKKSIVANVEVPDAVMSKINKNTTDIAELNTGKVSKVQGKDLSSNDYTDEEKTKLLSLEAVDLTELNTNNKTGLVAAINEINLKEGSGGGTSHECEHDPGSFSRSPKLYKTQETPDYANDFLIFEYNNDYYASGIDLSSSMYKLVSYANDNTVWEEYATFATLRDSTCVCYGENVYFIGGCSVSSNVTTEAKRVCVFNMISKTFTFLDNVLTQVRNKATLELVDDNIYIYSNEREGIPSFEVYNITSNVSTSLPMPEPNAQSFHMVYHRSEMYIAYKVNGSGKFGKYNLETNAFSELTVDSSVFICGLGAIGHRVVALDGMTGELLAFFNGRWTSLLASRYEYCGDAIMTNIKDKLAIHSYGFPFSYLTVEENPLFAPTLIRIDKKSFSSYEGKVGEVLFCFEDRSLVLFDGFSYEVISNDRTSAIKIKELEDRIARLETV